jgi:hypothetical protein
MLGELIGEARGKRTGRRVVQTRAGMRVEISFEDTGKMLGLDTSGFGTYSAELRPDGTFHGEGQGILTTKTGETAKWRGMGVGHRTGNAVSWRGALSYYSASPTLSRLNGIAVIFEFEGDEPGNTRSKFWEWK